MQVEKLTRDASSVTSKLKELEDGSLVCLEPMSITTPTRYVERGLAELGQDTYVVGIFALICGESYAVSLINAMMKIEPSSITTMKIKGEEYYRFDFDKGATLLTSLNLVKKDVLVYKIYDEILSKGKVPWFMTYEDMGAIFSSAKKHAGTHIGSNAVITELIVSLITRTKEDKTKYYRTIVETQADLLSKPPVFIPLKSVEYAATNTTNKLAGSYFADGVISALVNPAERRERLEDILMS